MEYCNPLIWVQFTEQGCDLSANRQLSTFFSTKSIIPQIDANPLRSQIISHSLPQTTREPLSPSGKGTPTVHPSFTERRVFPPPPFFPQILAPILRYDFAHLPPDERNHAIAAHVTLTSQYTIPYYDATLLHPRFHHLH